MSESHAHTALTGTTHAAPMPTPGEPTVTRRKRLVVITKSAAAPTATSAPATAPAPTPQALAPKKPRKPHRPKLGPGRTLVSDKPVLSGKFVVIRIGGGMFKPGLVVHETRATADSEALRLAGLVGDPFIVAELGAVVTAPPGMEAAISG